ncbi:hypothetical protein [Neisseria leonii]|uniref:hypothetical protein n=1 Tax=Neisseria leonii TaxID=2995413 RepID=UPI00237AAC39|nr:hypothetical protein [Neisseria sp. 3986]MDD9325819.1 hypothetical protein [Neisseria sp. 3986]
MPDKSAQAFRHSAFVRDAQIVVHIRSLFYIVQDFAGRLACRTFDNQGMGGRLFRPACQVFGFQFGCHFLSPKENPLHVQRVVFVFDFRFSVPFWPSIF